MTPVTVAINDELLAALRSLPSRLTSPYVFPNEDGTGALDGREFDRLVFQPALLRAGINKVGETRETTKVRAGQGVRTVEKLRRTLTRSFRWKDLRHTFATRLRMTGVDTGTIRDLLGHTSDRMTKRYAHAVPGLLHAAVQRLLRAAPAHAAPAGDPPGDPSGPTPKVFRAGERPTSRSASATRSVPGGIRTHVTDVKGRCPRPD